MITVQFRTRGYVHALFRSKMPNYTENIFIYLEMHEKYLITLLLFFYRFNCI